MSQYWMLSCNYKYISSVFIRSPSLSFARRYVLVKHPNQCQMSWLTIGQKDQGGWGDCMLQYYNGLRLLGYPSLMKIMVLNCLYISLLQWFECHLHRINIDISLYIFWIFIDLFCSTGVAGNACLPLGTSVVRLFPLALKKSKTPSVKVRVLYNNGKVNICLCCLLVTIFSLDFFTSFILCIAVIFPEYASG